VWNEMGKDNE